MGDGLVGLELVPGAVDEDRHGCYPLALVTRPPTGLDGAASTRSSMIPAR
jgi:hypothetical protein